jgi:hypothetical protein
MATNTLGNVFPRSLRNSGRNQRLEHGALYSVRVHVMKVQLRRVQNQARIRQRTEDTSPISAAQGIMILKFLIIVVASLKEIGK